MNIEYLPLYVSLISVAGTIILGILQFRLTKANAVKSGAEASEVITRAATALLEPYVKENKRLLGELEERTKALQACEERCPPVD